MAHTPVISDAKIGHDWYPKCADLTQRRGSFIDKGQRSEREHKRQSRGFFSHTRTLAPRSFGLWGDGA